MDVDPKDEIEFDSDSETFSFSCDSNVSSIIYLTDDNMSQDETSSGSFEIDDDPTLPLVKKEMQLITETTTTTETITKEANTVLKVNKATQTYEDDFPEQQINRPGTLKLPKIEPSTQSTSNNKSNKLKAPNKANKKSTVADPAKKRNTSNTVKRNAINPAKKRNTSNPFKNKAINPAKKGNTLNHFKSKAINRAKKCNSSNAVNNNVIDTAKKNNNSNLNAANSNDINPAMKNDNSSVVDNKEQSSKNSSASTSKNTSNNNSQNSLTRTWIRRRTYHDHRIQPYQRPQNNKTWNNQPQNYHPESHNYNDNFYNRYGARSDVDHYNNNSYGEQPCNNIYQQRNWQVQNYNHEFKERLFTGFVRFMDFVFDYNYSRDTRFQN